MPIVFFTCSASFMVNFVFAELRSENTNVDINAPAFTTRSTNPIVAGWIKNNVVIELEAYATITVAFFVVNCEP
jgi:hypothetical protein